MTTTATTRTVTPMIAAEREPGAGPSSAAAGCGMSLIAALFDDAYRLPPGIELTFTGSLPIPLKQALTSRAIPPFTQAVASAAPRRRAPRGARRKGPARSRRGQLRHDRLGVVRARR